MKITAKTGERKIGIISFLSILSSVRFESTGKTERRRGKIAKFMSCSYKKRPVS